VTADQPGPDRNPFEHIGEQLRDAMQDGLAPVRRFGAVTNQLKLSKIPAQHSCHHLCPVYAPHLCDGWAAKDVTIEVPADSLFGTTPPPLQVQVCATCAAAPLRDP
jgi:hypothetical protein